MILKFKNMKRMRFWSLHEFRKLWDFEFPIDFENLEILFHKVKPTLKPCWDRYIGYHYWAKSFRQYICKVRFYPDLGNKHLHSHHYWFCKHFLCNFVFRWHKLEYPSVNHQVSWWFLSNCLRCVCLLDKLLLVASLSSKWIDGQPEKAKEKLQ